MRGLCIAFVLASRPDKAEPVELSAPRAAPQDGDLVLVLGAAARVPLAGIEGAARYPWVLAEVLQPGGRGRGDQRMYRIAWPSLQGPTDGLKDKGEPCNVATGQDCSATQLEALMAYRNPLWNSPRLFPHKGVDAAQARVRFTLYAGPTEIFWPGVAPVKELWELYRDREKYADELERLHYNCPDVPETRRELEACRYFALDAQVGESTAVAELEVPWQDLMAWTHGAEEELVGWTEPAAAMVRPTSRRAKAVRPSRSEPSARTPRQVRGDAGEPADHGDAKATDTKVSFLRLDATRIRGSGQKTLSLIRHGESLWNELQSAAQSGSSSLRSRISSVAQLGFGTKTASSNVVKRLKEPLGEPGKSARDFTLNQWLEAWAAAAKRNSTFDQQKTDALMQEQRFAWLNAPSAGRQVEDVSLKVDFPLSEEGVKQCVDNSNELMRSEGVNVLQQATLLLTSPLARAVETALVFFAPLLAAEDRNTPVLVLSRNARERKNRRGYDTASDRSGDDITMNAVGLLQFQLEQHLKTQGGVDSMALDQLLLLDDFLKQDPKTAPESRYTDAVESAEVRTSCCCRKADESKDPANSCNPDSDKNSIRVGDHCCALFASKCQSSWPGNQYSTSVDLGQCFDTASASSIFAVAKKADMAARATIEDVGDGADVIYNTRFAVKVAELVAPISGLEAWGAHSSLAEALRRVNRADEQFAADFTVAYLQAAAGGGRPAPGEALRAVWRAALAVGDIQADRQELLAARSSLAAASSLLPAVEALWASRSWRSWRTRQVTALDAEKKRQVPAFKPSLERDVYGGRKPSKEDAAADAAQEQAFAAVFAPRGVLSPSHLAALRAVRPEGQFANPTEGLRAALKDAGLAFFDGVETVLPAVLDAVDQTAQNDAKVAASVQTALEAHEYQVRLNANLGAGCGAGNALGGVFCVRQAPAKGRLVERRIVVNDAMNQWFQTQHEKESSADIVSRVEEFVNSVMLSEHESVAVVGHSLYFALLMNLFAPEKAPAQLLRSGRKDDSNALVKGEDVLADGQVKILANAQVVSTIFKWGSFGPYIESAHKVTPERMTKSAQDIDLAAALASLAHEGDPSWSKRVQMAVSAVAESEQVVNFDS